MASALFMLKLDHGGPVSFSLEFTFVISGWSLERLQIFFFKLSRCTDGDTMPRPRVSTSKFIPVFPNTECRSCSSCERSWRNQFSFFVRSALSCRSAAVWYGKHFMWNVGHSMSMLAPCTHTHTVMWLTQENLEVLLPPIKEEVHVLPVFVCLSVC